MSNVLIPNCIVTLTRASDNLILATGVVANMQRDKRANLPEMLQGRGMGGLDLSFCYRARLDTPGIGIPGIGDVLSVISFNNPLNAVLAGQWDLWDEPQLGTLMGTVLLYVRRKPA